MATKQHITTRWKWIYHQHIIEDQIVNEVMLRMVVLLQIKEKRSICFSINIKCREIADRRKEEEKRE